jgi:hypothetical protein
VFFFFVASFLSLSTHFSSSFLFCITRNFFTFLFHSPLLTHLGRVLEGSLQMKKGKMKEVI